jgi:hypothetical protein
MNAHSWESGTRANGAAATKTTVETSMTANANDRSPSPAIAVDKNAERCPASLSVAVAAR